MPTASAIKALIVDDQLTSRALIRDGLQQLGFQDIEMASDGEQGLKVRSDRALSIGHVFDAGDLGGISCGMTPEPNAKEALVVSLSHLRIAPDHPLAREIQAYQRERIKSIASTSA